MNYEIRGTIHQIVELQLQPGQRVMSETGGMIWMDPNIDLDTSMPESGGGLMGMIGGALGRAVAGESIFMNYFQAEGSSGRVAFASSFPGHIVPYDIQPGRSLLAQRGSFLCSQDSCTVKLEPTGLGKGFLGGEGFILQRMSGPGTVFLEIDGELSAMELEAGQTIKVDTGHIAAFEDTVTYNFEIQKKLKNIFLSGEGLALATLTGPGKVWLQHQVIRELAQRLIPYLPSKSN
ncbi:TIGR00266 family protein [bacterium]|nr:TIGR00266 family protein [bacterium]